LKEITFPILTEIINGGTASSPGATTFSAFVESSGVEKVSFPSLTTIETKSCFLGAFKNCKKLTDVDFSAVKEVSSLGTTFRELCYDCSALTDVDFSSLEVANTQDFYRAFYGCSALQEVRFPALKTIGNKTFDGAFTNCTSLKRVYFNSVENVHKDSFQGTTFTNCTALEEIHFPAGMENIIAATTSYSTRWGAPSTCQILFDL
jgi:hypothetical protein